MDRKLFMKNIFNTLSIFLVFILVNTNIFSQSTSTDDISNTKSDSNTFWTYSKWIFSGLAIGGLGGSLLFKNSADNALTEYNNATNSSTASASRDDVEKNINMANTSLVIGAISAGFALLSWILDAGDESQQPIKFEKPKDEKTKPPVSPPVLASTIQFFDTTGDNFLEAGENGKIVLTLSNDGGGIAFSLQPKIKNDNRNITVTEPSKIPQLNPSEKRDVTFFLSANENLLEGRASFEILVYEDNGFDLTPSAKISIPTKKYREPKLVVSDIAIKDNNNNRKIDLSEIVEVTARVQNIGEGNARNVKANLQIGQNIFTTADSKTSFELGNIQSGDFRDVTFSMYTNNRATDINISLSLNEERPKFSSSQKLDLALNKVEKTTSELVVQGKETPKTEIQISKLNVDIAQNIPVTSSKNKDAVAVVIGNQNYSNPSVPFVEYAINDASLVREYLIKTLGYDEVNIFFEPNATQAKFISIFGSNDDYKGKLFNYLKASKSDLFIYYSGHGAPDPQSQQGYFVPVDCDPSTVRLNGYSLNTFYQNLSQLPYKSLTVVIDACFSGSSDKGMLLKNISPIYISVENPVVTKENTIVFTSASGDQVSSWYPEMKHSLFTYYFLKGLKGESDTNNDRAITVSELKNFIDENVPYMARRLNSREQTPQVIGELNSVIVELK